MPAGPNEPQVDTDLLDAAMENRLVNAGVSRIRHLVGPSCLASLVIMLILIVLLKRWVHLPPVTLIAVSFVVWLLVLGLLARLRNNDEDWPDGELD